MTDVAELRTDDKSGRGRSVLLFFRDLLVIFVAALLISFLVKTFLVRPFWIPSTSMSTTLQVDDRVIVSLLTPTLIPLEHGDIVVFEDPGGWLQAPEPQERTEFEAVVDWFLTFVGLAPEDDHGYLIKRIIGLPGDRVACCNDFGQVTINDVPIEEPYVLLDDPNLPASGQDFDVTVPEGHLWLMGDNRYGSADSRAHIAAPGGGFVPIESVIGRAVLVSWPFDHWRWLDRYEQVYVGVEPDDPVDAPSDIDDP